MARHSFASVARSPSITSSIVSNIVVKSALHNNDAVSASTPPTSCEPDSSTPRKAAKPEPSAIDDQAVNDTAARATRKRKSINYDEQAQTAAASSRNVSGLTGKTLVHGDDEDEQQSNKKRRTEIAFPEELPPRPHRQSSIKDRVKKVAGQIGSVLGKRKILKELDTGRGGLLDELDLDAEHKAARPTKRLRKDNPALEKLTTAKDSSARVSAVSVSAHSIRRRKKWLAAGLYVGQQQTDMAKQKKKLQKRPTTMEQAMTNTAVVNSIMPLPMFGFLDNTRDFTIPFDVFAPSLKKGDDKPKDWHKLNGNRLVGEAKELWKKEAPLAMSLCTCSPPSASGQRGCDDNCLNRAMHYECDDNNCGLPPAQCGNRAFTDLEQRVKKGGKFDIGVEILKTPNRGFGIRACRAFAPGDIIMEYTGEIISEAECQLRMSSIYINKQSYYIMEFDQGLHIDGTKGSMARFVNHSCEPNCEVRMVKVSGKPRMAIFARDEGVFTGEELTYDYNFDNFGDTRQSCYCGAPSCRGLLARRLNATEQKQKDKEDKERREQAELEAKKHAAAEAKKKTVKRTRGSGWKGWTLVEDVLPHLRQEKVARDDAEKSSSRAKRLAQRLIGKK